MLKITTKRLELTPFQNEDLDLFHQINTDPFVRRYLWDDVAINRETAREILELNQNQFKTSQYGLWKINIKGSPEIIGYTGLWHFFDESQPQLIYALLPTYCKQGFAFESSRAIIDYAFDQLQFTYLIAATDEPHLASQRLAMKLGMSFVEKRLEDGKATLFYRIERS